MWPGSPAFPMPGVRDWEGVCLEPCLLWLMSAAFPTVPGDGVKERERKGGVCVGGIVSLEIRCRGLGDPHRLLLLSLPLRLLLCGAPGAPWLLCSLHSVPLLRQMQGSSHSTKAPAPLHPWSGPQVWMCEAFFSLAGMNLGNCVAQSQVRPPAINQSRDQ